MAATATEFVLPVCAFPGGAELRGLIIPPSADVRPYREGMEAGRLMLQCCAHCGRCRNPIGPVCPYCQRSGFSWQPSQGHGRVVSWVRFRRGYLPEFEALLPYVVLCVELRERVRLFGRLADRQVDPQIGMNVSAIIERWADGGLAPAFVAASGGE